MRCRDPSTAGLVDPTLAKHFLDIRHLVIAHTVFGRGGPPLLASIAGADGAPGVVAAGLAGPLSSARARIRPETMNNKAEVPKSPMPSRQTG